VIANAGIQAFEPLASTSEEDWNNVIDIKVKRTANTARAALPHMLSRKYGRIVLWTLRPVPRARERRPRVIHGRFRRSGKILMQNGATLRNAAQIRNG